MLTRILFVPDVEKVGTSERSPALYRLLKGSYEVIGLTAPWDRFIYDTDRAKFPRYLLYLLDKALLVWRGISLVRQHHIELVFCETAHHAIPGLIISRILGIRCVWDSHGNVKLFAESVGKGWFYSRLAATLEGFLGKRVDALITVAQQDLEAYVRMGVPSSNIHVIPTCVSLSEIGSKESHEQDSSQTRRHASTTPIILFFGMFKYAPNREALEFINATVAPYLERNGIQCEIWIAGKDIPDMPFHPFIDVLGFVPDLYACIRSANLCVIPLWKGQGVEGAVLTKVLDVMAVGTPAVLSEYSARGIPGIQHGTHAFVASTEQEFLHLVLEALSNPEACIPMARQARKLIEEEYDWESQRPRLEGILQGEQPIG